MLGAELGEGGLERLLHNPAGRDGRQDLTKGRAVKAQGRGVIVAGGDEDGTAALDIARDIFEIEQRQDTAALIAVEDDQVELFELLLKQFARGKRDQRKLIDGRAILFFRRPQNGEVDEIDRRIRLQHVAPGTLAGVRLAGDKQHAEILAHALDGQHDAVVDLGELVLGGLDFDLDNVRPGMIDCDGHLHRFADAHAARLRRLALPA